MAEAMEGIMSLLGEQPTQEFALDPSNYSPVIEGYARSDPKQFGRDILGGIAEADPALVDGFIRRLAQIELPPEVIEALQMMIDGILSDPSNYAEDRAELIAEGVPAEILPERFDPAYFAAFNIAVDQLALSIPPEVPRFAEGGIVNARVLAKELAAMGRNGDTMLAHITPLEARMLRKMGGSGTINPDTGLPEFFFKKIKKAVGKVFKGIGKAVSSVVKGIGNVVQDIASSTIGKMALTFAAVYFMGPAGLKLAGTAGSLTGVTNAVASNMINTFAGSTLVNVASGQKIGDAIKGGIVSGALAGAGTAAFGGGVPGAPRDSLAPVIDKSTNLASTAGTSLDNTSLLSTIDDAAAVTGKIPTPASAGPSAVNVASPVPAPAQTFAYQPPPPVQGFPIGQSPSTLGTTPGAGSALEPFKVEDIYQKYTGVPTPAQGVSTTGLTPSVTQNVAAPGAPSTGGITNIAKEGVGQVGTSSNVMDLIKQGDVGGAAKEIWNSISPSGIKEQGTAAAIDAGNKAAALVTDPALKAVAYQKAYDAALPGVIAQYGPLLGLGLGAATLMGGFTPEPSQIPPGFSGPTGTELLAANPSMYGLSFGGTRASYAPINPYETMYTPPTNPYRNPVQGGINSVARLAKGGTAEFPRKTGPINGPGTGTSDSVPAMLSDGEFVFTAKAVRAMGNGSRRKGAKRMYAMMKDLERKVNG